MAKSKLLPGWHRVKGSSRYTTPAGVEVSKRQYNNARAAAAGLDASYSLFERMKKVSSYNRFAVPAAAAGRGGRTLDSEYTRRYRELTFTAEGRLRKSNEFTSDPGGPFAEFLVWIGLRPEGATWPVGKS